METLAMRKRNPGIDVLRALSMFFVICLHILGQGGIMEHIPAGTGKYYFLRFLQILAYCAVDVYGITTGYVMCRKKFRLARLARLWVTTVFWSVAVSCCFFAVVPDSRTIEEAISMFLPILRGRYWFFTAYFVVMLISPVLNIVVHTLSIGQFRLLFAALFLIFGVVPVGSLGYDVMRVYGGNHFSWMIVLYLIGGYLHKQRESLGDQKAAPVKWLSGFFLFGLVHLIFCFAMNTLGLGHWSGLLLTCVSPLVVGEAVCLFLCFCDVGQGLREDSAAGKLIGFVTPGVYAVYIIHVHPQVFWSREIIDLFRVWDPWSGAKIFGAMVITAVTVFALCVLLDALRQRLFRVLRIDQLTDCLADRAEERVRRLLSE